MPKIIRLSIVLLICSIHFPEALSAEPFLEREYRYYAHCTDDSCEQGFISSAWATKVGDCKGECPWLYENLQLPLWFQRVSPMIFAAKNVTTGSGYYLFEKKNAAPGWLRECLLLRNADVPGPTSQPTEESFYRTSMRPIVLKSLAECDFAIYKVSFLSYYWWKLKSEGSLHAIAFTSLLIIFLLIAVLWFSLIRISNSSTFRSARKAPPSVS